MSPLALVTMIVVQVSVTIITLWFLIRTLRKSNQKDINK